MKVCVCACAYVVYHISMWSLQFPWGSDELYNRRIIKLYHIWMLCVYVCVSIIKIISLISAGGPLGQATGGLCIFYPGL